MKSSGIVDGATFTPNNGFTFIDFASEGGVDNSTKNVDELIFSTTGNGDYIALDAFRWGMATLPVKLISFYGKKENKGILLLWKTASERYNEKFEIEESYDGYEFQKIGLIQGAGTSFDQQDYSFKVEKPRNAITYYRIKQIDFDGKFEYSKTIRISLKGEVGEFYPNPSQSGLINLEFYAHFDDEIEFSIFDMNGKLVFNQVRLVSEGDNNIMFDISDLNTGIYVVEIGNEVNLIHRKIIIEK